MNLLLISLGPVQDFIVNARRSRDLWFGSHLLSELSRATAKCLADNGWELIFPALDRAHPELEPAERMWRAKTDQPPLSIVNKVLARGEGDPQVAAAKAREAALSRWRVMASNIQAKVGRLLRTDAALAGAFDDVLEFCAAWISFTDQNYAEKRSMLDVAVSERKQIRDFTAWVGQPGIPKSSLDGFRESVLKERNPSGRSRLVDEDPEVARLVRRFRLAPGEHLDALGVVKRMGDEPDQFVPLWRVALEPWIAAVDARAQGEQALWSAWTALQEECGKQGVRAIRPNATAWVQKFKFDGELFMQDRWERLLSDDPTPEDRERGRKLGRCYVKPILRLVGPPPPSYVACLVADGDHMGKTLRGLLSPELHRRFSVCLLEFAQSARGLIEAYGGALVYAGGDDVLAFLPVLGALGCAKTLQEHFTGVFSKLAADLPAEQQRVFSPPTLSVGIGIGHVMNPMGELLELARAAERTAKVPRAALAVIIEKRGGERASACSSWKDDPVAHLGSFLDALRTQTLPAKAPFEVRDLLHRFPNPTQLSAEEQAEWAAILHADLVRTLRRKGAPSSALSPEKVWLPVEPGQSYTQLHEAISIWVERAKVVHCLLDFAQAVERVEAKGQQKAVAA